MDVIIIGSGAGGGASAWALTQQGIKVLVLEAGPAYNPYKDYRLSQNNWELDLFPDQQKHKLKYSFSALQALDQQYTTLRSWNHIGGLFNTSSIRKASKYHHVQGVGGSTLHFTGEAHRLHPKAFTLNSQLGVAADWPLSYEDLESYYDAAEKLLGVSGDPKDNSRPRSKPFPLPAHQAGYASQKILSGSKKTDFDWVANPLAVLSEHYDNRPACNYCNNCNRGCPRKDKGSVDVTFIHKAVQSGYCQVQSDTTVLRIISAENDRVQGVEYIDKSGERQSASAKIVIVACGAVETPRLLLLSENADHQALANESGLVGKNFMETLFWVSSAIHPENIGSHRGLPSDIISWRYNAPDSIPGVIGGCRFAPATAEADLIGPVNYARRVIKGWGLQHKQDMRDYFGHAMAIGAIGESLPNSQSFISLDKDKKDRFNRPIAKIHSYLTVHEIKRLIFMANKCREILTLSGAEQIFEEYGSYDFFNSTHVFGTARMGNNPDSSVVNSYCQSHRWKNLFIVDASVFPSSGGGESPSLTIEALAIRTAHYIQQSLINKEL